MQPISRGVSDFRREAGLEKKLDLSNVTWQHTCCVILIKLTVKQLPASSHKKTNVFFFKRLIWHLLETLQIYVWDVLNYQHVVIKLVLVTSYLSRTFFAPRKGRMSCECWWWACTSRASHIAPPTVARGHSLAKIPSCIKFPNADLLLLTSIITESHIISIYFVLRYSHATHTPRWRII